MGNPATRRADARLPQPAAAWRCRCSPSPCVPCAGRPTPRPAPDPRWSMPTCGRRTPGDLAQCPLQQLGRILLDLDDAGRVVTGDCASIVVRGILFFAVAAVLSDTTDKSSQRQRHGWSEPQPSSAASAPLSADCRLFKSVHPSMRRQLAAPACEWLLLQSPRLVGHTLPDKDLHLITSTKFAWRMNEKAEPAGKRCDGMHSPRA